MAVTPIDGHPHDWPLLIFGAVLVLAGLVLAVSGAWPMATGGSWYYMVAGIGLVIAGVQIARGQISGAWWFFAVCVGTLLWTVWEGLDYWRWVPRFGLIVAPAFVLALLLPRLDDAPPRKVSRALAILFALMVIAAFALAVVPYGITRNDFQAWNAQPPANGGT